MLFAFRVLVYSLTLSLSFNGSLLPLLPSTPSSLQSSDEEAVRALTEKYGLAIAAGDLETMRELWHPPSPNIPSRLRPYQDALFSTTRFELTRMKVTRLTVTGEKAVSHLTADERRLDRSTGTVSTIRDIVDGVCRAFEWIKTSAGWKIERELLVQDELAAKLEAAASEQERNELLEKEKAFVTIALVVALTTRGLRYAVRGDPEAALRCYQLQLAVAEKIGDKAGVAGAWMNIGALRYIRDDYEQSLPYLQRSLELYEAAGNKRGVALVLEKLSRGYRALGDQRLSFDCAQKALRLYEQANYRRGIADALSELASVYSTQNNHRQALAHLERALAIAQQLGDRVNIAMLRHEVATQHQQLGNFELAIETYRDLLQQTEAFGDRGGVAVIRSRIGTLFEAQGRYAEALDYYGKALSEFEALNLRRSTSTALNHISSVYLAEGKHDEALPFAQRAVSLSRQAGQQLDLWFALMSLGYSQLGLNNLTEARHALVEAVSIIEELRALTAGGAYERQRYLEGRLLAHHGMLSLLVKENKTTEALVFAERTKARVLLDVLQRGRVSIQKTMTVEEREQERGLKAELIRLNTRLTRATQSETQDARRIGELKPLQERARLSYEAFQTSLYAAHPELKVQRGEAPVIKAEELATLLPDSNSALLEYVVTDDVTYLFAVVRPQGQPAAELKLFSIPIKRAELAREAESFRKQLAGRVLGFRASAHNLYDLLLKPAQSLLTGKTSLVIVPDERLWELPFQALLDDEDRYVIEKSALAYVPSLTVLREMRAERDRRPVAARSTLLALGNPAIGNETIERAQLTLRDSTFTSLPEAEQEVRALGKLYGATHSKVYIGREAREDRVKAEAQEAGILHFATHGILSNAAPLYSHLMLAQGDKNEDGLLEAWELMQLGLKADLAVLSACETARGRFGAGEGVIGLTWALFVAGVPATVVSQWKVESAATRDLMLAFHTQLRTTPSAAKSRVTKAAALRSAALKIMKNPQTRHPFYWAGFVLTGDGR